MTNTGKRKKKEQDINIGKKYSMRSKVLKEERPYWVCLPHSYEESNIKRRYPVLYLLDGDAHFPSVSGVVHFLSSISTGNNRIPELIVVAIPNTDRMRDLSPTHTQIGYFGEEDASLKSSGGGDAFLRYIQEELFPQIDSKFHTLPLRIFVGHSLGGLLAIHALFEHPDMFQAYIAIDPSLWWDNQVLLRNAKNKVKTLGKLRKTLFITSANNPRFRKMEKGIGKFANVLRAARTANFRLGFQHFDAEDHASVPLLSLYQGLLFIFEGFKQTDFESLSTLKARFQRLSKRLGADILPSEGYVNDMGYKMLYLNKDVKKAIAFFEYNVSQFPKSANAYDSLAEGYMTKGDTARAIENYQKSLKLNPDNQNAARRLQELKKKKTTDA